MELFDREEKINFVDKNNVVLGYDTDQQCCENAGWFLADQPTDHIIEEESVLDWDEWNFDPEYFQETGIGSDEGCMAIFRLVNGEKQKFLHLFNCHNGYYSHNFVFTNNNEILHRGDL